MSNHINDCDEFYYEIIEVVLDCSYKFYKRNTKVIIPFEIKDQPDASLFDVGPYMQFYLESNYEVGKLFP